MDEKQKRAIDKRGLTRQVLVIQGASKLLLATDQAEVFRAYRWMMVNAMKTIADIPDDVIDESFVQEGTTELSVAGAEVDPGEDSNTGNTSTRDK